MAPVDFVPVDGRMTVDGDLWNCIAAAAERHADQLAMDDGQRQLSYRDCMERVSELSSRLQGMDPARDRISVVLLDTGIESALAMLALIRAGIVFVPVDVAISPDRIRALIRSCDPALVITDARHRDILDDPDSRFHVVLIDQPDIGDQRNRPLPAVTGDEVCRVLTSGSTGAPKQIIYTQKMILHDAYVRTNSLKIASSDRFSQWIGGTSLPLMTLFLSVLNGASLHIHDIHKLGMAHLPAWIRENRITILRLTPTLLRLLMEQCPDASDLSSVRLVSTGGEALMPADVEMFRTVFSEGTVLLNHLSATEYRVACQYVVDAETSGTDSLVPVGYPLTDVEIEIVGEDGRPVPDGETGEIALRSAYISPGYVDTDSGEHRAYDVTPGGFYLTGDLGLKRVDGCIEHHGRKDHMVKIRGIRVQLDAAESVISRLDGVGNAVVLSVAGTDGEPVLVACVVEAPGADISLKQLRQALYTELGLYGLPHRIEKRDSLPLTANGKIDRTRLRTELMPVGAGESAQSG